MPATAIPFTIHGQDAGRDRHATRLQAASALLLADLWAEAGYRHVRVTDPTGAIQDRQAFRRAFLRSRRKAPA